MKRDQCTIRSLLISSYTYNSVVPCLLSVSTHRSVPLANKNVIRLARRASENHGETGQKRAHPFSPSDILQPSRRSRTSHRRRNEARVATGSRLIAASSKYSLGCSFVRRRVFRTAIEYKTGEFHEPRASIPRARSFRFSRAPLFPIFVLQAV